MKALVIDDDPLIRDNVAEALRADDWIVSEAESAEQALRMIETDRWSLVFCDVKLGDETSQDGFDLLRHFTKEQPEAQIVLMTGHGSAVGALDATAFGAYDYLLKPFDITDVLGISRTVRTNLEKQAHAGAMSEQAADPVYTSDIDLVGCSAAFVEVMKLVGRVAATNLPVLITGESGTGKEIVARAIHLRSHRASEPFVAVNCGAIPSELIESELFGHVRGSFTGAVADRRGLWQEADGGTILLDEITETSPAFQVKLLRALQESEIRRVGSNQTVKVDVRVIAATNRNLEEETYEGRFRQDLLYRLNAVTLHLPPLRERREDIMSLAHRFAARDARREGPPVVFSREVIELLENYPWPGNIRELENAIVRAVALSDQIVRPEDLPERIRNVVKETSKRTEYAPPVSTEQGDEDLLSLAEMEGRHVAHVLARMGGNKQAAARVLGIDRTTLKRMIQRHNLNAGE
jgi:DNA-binding NtrC family response regulator